jgi:serine/threonine-protein kinase RsbW
MNPRNSFINNRCATVAHPWPQPAPSPSPLASPTVPWPAAPWPLSDTAGPLPASELTPSSIRAGTRQALAGWNLPDAVDTIALVATELVTNAIRASAPLPQATHHPLIRVSLLTDHQVARLEVWDEAPGLPHLRDTPTPATADQGRGLILVNALTHGTWGWTQLPALHPAKCVWAEIPLAPTHPPTPLTIPAHTPRPAHLHQVQPCA